MFRRSKIVLIFLIVMLVLGMTIYSKITFLSDNKSLVVKEIKEYNYVCKSNSSDLFIKKFNELDIILKEEVDYELYAKKIVELFVIDFYTLNNKDNKNDVGGIQFIYDDIKDNFILNATNTIYKYVETNINGNRNQELPVVSKITKINVEPVNYNEYDAYKVVIKWNYQKKLGYDSEGTFIVIKNNNKLYIVEKE